jgi:hypothetical protein
LLRRHSRTILVLLILAATAAAFVVTEDLKLEPDPIAAPKITRTFSPVCRCDQQAAKIAFRLKEPDTLTLTIADSTGQDIRTLLRDAKFHPGSHQFGWDGRDDSGKVVPEGRYEARVRLEKLGRVITFPGGIRVDTTRPKIRATHVSRRVISPDGDGRGDAITIRYQASEPSHALLLVNGRRRAFTRLRAQGAIRWAPKRFRAGLQRLQLGAVDAAGNRGAGKPFYVQVRYLQVSPTRLRTRPRRIFTVRVSTDYPRYTWRLGRRSGTGRAHALSLRAPATPGRYTLAITAGSRRATASILVRSR